MLTNKQISGLRFVERAHEQGDSLALRIMQESAEQVATGTPARPCGYCLIASAARTAQQALSWTRAGCTGAADAADSSLAQLFATWLGDDDHDSPESVCV